MLEKLPLSFDVSSLRSELKSNPSLWDDFDLRTNHPLSPHREMSDIFLRYNPRDNYDGDRQKFNTLHTSKWWDAERSLPSAKGIVNQLTEHLGSDELGMVLMTRLPAGKTCYPHIDDGWHARHYEKFGVLVTANMFQSFHVEDSQLNLQSGDCFTFDNSKVHWVDNPSDEDRLTMIVCIRR